MDKRKPLPQSEHEVFSTGSESVAQVDDETGTTVIKTYDEEKCCRIARLVARAGGSNEDITEALDIEISTLERWRQTYPAFSEALNAWMKSSEATATGQALKMALGYTHTKEKVVNTREGPISVTLRVHVPPCSRSPSPPA